MKRPTLIHQFLENSCELAPEKGAALFLNKWTKYQDIELRSNRLSNYLRRIGVKKQDRVAVLIENSIEYIISLFAILKVGAVVVPLHADIKAANFAYILLHAEAKVVISKISYAKTLVPAIKEARCVSHLLLDAVNEEMRNSLVGQSVTGLNEILESEEGTLTRSRIIDIDLAEIVYTSGSTGKPKGVMLTHLNLVSNMHSIVDYLNIGEDDRIMCILPFSYIYGQSLLLTHFLVAGSVIIDNRFLFPNTVLQTMIDQEATGFAGVPSTFSILLTRSAVRQFKFPLLRYVTQAGGGMAPDIQKEVAAVFAPAKLFVMYGATEASPRLSYLDPAMLPTKLGSIGKPIPNVELFVADENGNALPCGVEGEIVARGSNIMIGYWKDPEASRIALRKGLYFTGDLGVIDEEGYFFVIGRKKEIIKVKGHRISPKEIEEKLLGMSEITEASVIGIEDPILGEAIKAFVVLKKPGSTTEKEIMCAVNIDTPVYKQIKYVSCVETLPKNSAGKIDKNVLKNL
ncbi:MAG: acyl--CoA ligase [Thermoplasmata archaeon]|nr:acyl--CoA ligase [Thermoplasmata archaeon]